MLTPEKCHLTFSNNIQNILKVINLEIHFDTKENDV